MDDKPSKPGRGGNMKDVKSVEKRISLQPIWSPSIARHLQRLARLEFPHAARPVLHGPLLCRNKTQLYLGDNKKNPVFCL